MPDIQYLEPRLVCENPPRLVDFTNDRWRPLAETVIYGAGTRG